MQVSGCNTVIMLKNALWILRAVFDFVHVPLDPLSMLLWWLVVNCENLWSIDLSNYYPVLRTIEHCVLVTTGLHTVLFASWELCGRPVLSKFLHLSVDQPKSSVISSTFAEISPVSERLCPRETSPNALTPTSIKIAPWSSRWFEKPKYKQPKHGDPNTNKQCTNDQFQ